MGRRHEELVTSDERLTFNLYYTLLFVIKFVTLRGDKINLDLETQDDIICQQY